MEKTVRRRPAWLGCAAHLLLIGSPVAFLVLLGWLVWLLAADPAREAASPDWRPIAAPAPDVRCWQYGYSLTIVCLEEP